MHNRSFSRGNFHKSRFPRQNNRTFGRRRNVSRPSVSASAYVNKAEIQSSADETVITHRFEDFAIDPRLKQNISLHGYNIPTPIQDQVIPYILEGRDVIGIANTGTGKTAAFLVPLLNKIILNRNEKVLIIVPTRELAVQIEDELREFARSLNIYSNLIIGGASINRQILELRQNLNIIIGTPGRLKDLIKRQFLHLGSFQNIVLDEVDRMVDIGFIMDIKYIISQLSQNRQSLFFSATVPPSINSIIQSFLRNPITVSVKMKEMANGIDQDVIRVNSKEEKVEKLQNMLRLEEFKKVLIFGRTKWGVERLSKTLQQRGFLAASIHGNKSQSQRLRALSQFKQNQLQVLVATDIAARGIDVVDISHVINFDEPSTYTDYIHRIGRTGRAQKLGKALTFVG